MAGFFGRLFGRPAEPTLDTISAEDYFADDEAWTSVSSSNLVAVAYYGQGAAGELRIRFGKNGKATSEYSYTGVPLDVYHGLLGASSAGGYHARYVKWSYPFTPIW